jgi:hypothetical protein
MKNVSSWKIKCKLLKLKLKRRGAAINSHRRGQRREKLSCRMKSDR